MFPYICSGTCTGTRYVIDSWCDRPGVSNTFRYNRSYRLHKYADYSYRPRSITVETVLQLYDEAHCCSCWQVTVSGNDGNLGVCFWTCGPSPRYCFIPCVFHAPPEEQGSNSRTLIRIRSIIRSIRNSICSRNEGTFPFHHHPTLTLTADATTPCPVGVVSYFYVYFYYFYYISYFNYCCFYDCCFYDCFYYYSQ